MAAPPDGTPGVGFYDRTGHFSIPGGPGFPAFVSVNPNIGARQLQAQIDAYYSRYPAAKIARDKALGVYVDPASVGPSPGTAGRLAQDKRDAAAVATFTYDALNPNTIVYNVGGVIDAYHAYNPSFQARNNMKYGDRPVQVNNPMQLWSKEGAHKGMILLHVSKSNSVQMSGQTNGDGWGDPAETKPAAQARYGFQFLYNPSKITMTWGATDSVDPGYEMSGYDPFPNIPTSSTASSIIEFEVKLNRRYDMKYYDPATQLITKVNGATPNIYVPRMPSNQEQTAIYNKGTMYDIEYLLATVLRSKRNTSLMGYTADIGFLFPMLVEVHLGEGLRYLARLDNIRIVHEAFNERMVPIVSTMNVSLTRITDGPEKES